MYYIYLFPPPSLLWSPSLFVRSFASNFLSPIIRPLFLPVIYSRRQLQPFPYIRRLINSATRLWALTRWALVWQHSDCFPSVLHIIPSILSLSLVLSCYICYSSLLAYFCTYCTYIVRYASAVARADERSSWTRRIRAICPPTSRFVQRWDFF